MNDTARVYFDLGYLSEENKMLRDELKHWKLMYENLKKEYEDAVNKYDQLVMETVTRDLQQLGEIQEVDMFNTLEKTFLLFYSMMLGYGVTYMLIQVIYALAMGKIQEVRYE